MALKSDQPIRWKERIGLVVVGQTAKNVEEYVFDYLFYPVVIAWLGAMIGGVVMTVLSALECYLFVRFYDWSKKDWLGLELLKKIRDGGEMQGRIARFVQQMARKSDWLAFLALSYYTDPFVTTMYLRKGSEEYNGLSRRDWGIFWASVLVANFWWTIAVSLAVEGVRFLLHWFGRS